MSDKKLVQYKAYIDKESGSIVCNTLNASNNINLAGQLNLNDMILADPGNGFQLYGNDAQGYPTINFYTGSPGTGLLQYSVGVFNDIWYVIPNGGSQALQVSSDMSVNMPYSVSVCDGNGTFTCDGEATFNSSLTATSANISTTLSANSANISTTLTANTINATTITNPSGTSGTINVTGNVNVTNTLTANSANISTTLNANNIVATGLQLNVTGSNPQGLSIIGVTGTTPSDSATQIFFQSIAGETLTTHWQLGPAFDTANPPDFWLYNNIGKYNALQIHANTPLIDIYTNVIVTGNVNITETLTANTINATTITNPSGTSGTINVTGNVNVTNTLTANSANISTTLTAQQVICSPATQGAALHIYGDTDYSAELAFMTGTDKLFEVGATTTNVATGTGNFFFIYNNQNSTYSVQVITGSPQTINLNGNVNITNSLTANDIVATGASISSTLTATTINATGASISSTLTATTINATAINATTINTNNSISSVTGSESGSIIALEPFTGSGYKKVLLLLQDFAGSGVVTFSTAFSTTSIITSVTYTFQSGTGPIPTYAVNLSGFNITSDDELSSGSFVIEGY